MEKLERNVVCFDVETTGVNPLDCKILQLALVKFTPNFDIIDEKMWYIKPEGKFEISNSAEEIHHISKKFIEENGVKLKSIWPEVISMLNGCDLLGYNSKSFDLKVLYNNLKEIGITYDWNQHKMFDGFILESVLSSRKLSNVYKRYTGKEMEDAHDAYCDVLGTIEVFKHQLEIDKTWDEYMSDNKSVNILTPCGTIYINDSGELIFTAGKYSKRLTFDICKTDPNYIKWVFNHCSKECRELIKEDYNLNIKKL